MFRTASCIALVAAASVTAAPVPPPAPLTVERLAGVWHYEYGNWKDGVIVLNKDGTYVAVHEQGSGLMYFGTWRLDGNEVTLTEYRFCLDLNTTSGPMKYTFQFHPRDYPNLVECRKHSVRVAFTQTK